MAAGFHDLFAFLFGWKSSARHVAGPYRVAEAEVFSTGAAEGEIFSTGTATVGKQPAGEVFATGAAVGEVAKR